MLLLLLVSALRLLLALVLHMLLLQLLLRPGQLLVVAVQARPAAVCAFWETAGSW